jgi:adenylate kinase
LALLGSGKGTQAAKLVEKYNLAHISTGDLFRAEIQNKTPLGIKAMEFMSQGQLVPDQVTIEMLRNKVDSMHDVKGFYLRWISSYDASGGSFGSNA